MLISEDIKAKKTRFNGGFYYFLKLFKDYKGFQSGILTLSTLERLLSLTINFQLYATVVSAP
jgi:hypothetical protein